VFAVYYNEQSKLSAKYIAESQIAPLFDKAVSLNLPLEISPLRIKAASHLK
jgi:hypothetical protein